jgi:pilus assembly protein CpaE
MLAGARDFLVKPKTSELSQAIMTVREAEQRRRNLSSETAQGARAGEVLVVFGAKGGVGKTTLAVNLAVALGQESKQRVALVDLDTQLGDVGVMLDAVPEHSIVDAAQMVDRLEPHLIQTLMREDPHGIHVLAGPMRPQEGEFISAHHVAKIVEVMASTYDYVVIDTAPQFTDTVLPALEAATMLLLVTTPDVAALKNTKLALNVLKSCNNTTDKVKLVVTNAYADDGASQKDIETALEYPVFWVLPHDNAVAAAGKAGKPVVAFKPGSKMPQKVMELARSIAGATKPKGRLAAMFRR